MTDVVHCPHLYAYLWQF